MRIKDEFLAVLDTLKEGGVEHAVCGGWAVGIHGFPRATRDIDLLVQEDDIERIKDLLRPIGYTLSSGGNPFKVGTPEEQRLHRISKVIDQDLLMLDLMVVTPFLLDAWESRENYEFDGRRVPVVGFEGLIAMKETAGRPNDLRDIDELKRIRSEREG